MINLTDKQIVFLVGTGLLVAWYIKTKTVEAVSETVDAVGEAINPVSQNNIFNRGVNAIGEAISGQEGWSLGGWIYDITHDEELK